MSLLFCSTRSNKRELIPISIIQSALMSNCPTCSSAQTVKNGRIHNGKQRFLCRECGRQFVEQPSKRVIDAATRKLIDRLLLERISLAGIARAVQVSEIWLQQYVNEKYALVRREVEITPKKRGG
jgi:transposase-like protein